MIFTVGDIVQKLDCETVYAVIWDADYDFAMQSLEASRKTGITDYTKLDWENAEVILS